MDSIIDVPMDVWEWFGDAVVVAKLRQMCAALSKIPPMEPYRGSTGSFICGKYEKTEFGGTAILSRGHVIARGYGLDSETYMLAETGWILVAGANYWFTE